MTEQLNQLIEAIIADGVITPKERAVLHRRAQAEGISTDEIDILVEGRLIQLKRTVNQRARAARARAEQLKAQQAKAEQAKARAQVARAQAVRAKAEQAVKTPQTQQRTQNYGVVQKCPNCGSPVEGGTVKCASCGYEFRGIGANNCLVDLMNQIKRVGPRNQEAIKTLISNYPVPTTKDDLVEFIMFAKSKSRSYTEDDNALASCYRKKYYECVEKAQFYFKDDQQFQQIFADYQVYKKQWWKNLSKTARLTILGIIGYIILMAVALFLSTLDI